MENPPRTIKHSKRETSSQLLSPMSESVKLTVGVDWLSERRSDAEDRSNKDVLETRNEEQCRIFVIKRFELVAVDVGFGIPAR